MSGARIPSRQESLRRAEEHSEELKDQMSDANVIYKDARDLQDAVDPSIEDFQLPDAIDRMATETIELREQRKAFKADLEVFTEEAKELEEESHLLEMELQSTQITNEEPEEFTKERLAVIKRLFDADSRLTALVFQDRSLFDDAIQDIKAQGNQYVNKLHYLMEEVQSLKGDIQSANEDYNGRLGTVVQPLRQELDDAKQQLEASKALQSSTDEELANVKDQLDTVTQARQTSEIALQNEIETHKTEITRLQGESTTMRHLSTEIQSLSSENARAKAQITQLEGRLSQQDAKVDEMNTEKKDLRDRNDKQEDMIRDLQDTLKLVEETLSQHNNELQAQVNTTQARNVTLGTRVIQIEVENRALQADKGALSARNVELEAQIHTLKAEGGDMTGQIGRLEDRIRDLKVERDTFDGERGQHEAKIHDLQVEKDDLNVECDQYQAKIRVLEAEKVDLIHEHEQRIEALNVKVFNLEQEEASLIDNHQLQVEQVEKERDDFQDQVTDLQRETSALSIQNSLKQSQVKDLEGRVQRLENRCNKQMEEIRELKSELAGRDNTLQETIKRANTEGTSSLQQIQQLQHFLFSKMLLIQHDQTVSLSTSGYRLLLKRQQLSHDAPAQSIQGPLKEIMDTMTNSTETSTLAETYQLVLGSLTYLQSSTHFQEKEGLLECMEKFQTWLIEACKGRTSILGLALARVIKTIQEGPQFDPWFSIDRFDSARMIDARNSELPETTIIIGDGFTGIVLFIEGADIQVCQATDMFMQQQMDCGMQLVFDETLGLPNLQLLANSFPHKDQWQPLGVWAIKVGRFNWVMRSGLVQKPEEFEEL